MIHESIEVRSLKVYVTPQFVQDFLELFDSEESVERDYLKNILHKLYAKVSNGVFKQRVAGTTSQDDQKGNKRVLLQSYSRDAQIQRSCRTTWYSRKHHFWVCCAPSWRARDIFQERYHSFAQSSNMLLILWITAPLFNAFPNQRSHACHPPSRGSPKVLALRQLCEGNFVPYWTLGSAGSLWSWKGGAFDS